MANSFRIPFRAYLRARPARLWDAPRLYWAYGASFLQRLLRGIPRAVGLGLPGRGNLTVSLAGSFFSVRPRTNDLDLLVHHEPGVAQWFQVIPGEVVVDVGAHIGRYSLAAAQVASRVIAIEPDPANFAVLLENIRLNGLSNVTAIPVAMSRNPGLRPLNLAGGANRGTSSLESGWAEQPNPGSGGSTVEVQCDTLDHLADSLDLHCIDWLKIDVEGHEVAVLEGARTALGRTRHLILEVSQGTEEACASILESAGLERVAVEMGSPTSNWFLRARA